MQEPQCVSHMHFVLAFFWVFDKLWGKNGSANLKCEPVHLISFGSTTMALVLAKAGSPSCNVSCMPSWLSKQFARASRFSFCGQSLSLSWWRGTAATKARNYKQREGKEQLHMHLEGDFILSVSLVITKFLDGFKMHFDSIPWTWHVSVYPVHDPGNLTLFECVYIVCMRRTALQFFVRIYLKRGIDVVHASICSSIFFLAALVRHLRLFSFLKPFLAVPLLSHHLLSIKIKRLTNFNIQSKRSLGSPGNFRFILKLYD